jgi:hypothetical protein
MNCNSEKAHKREKNLEGVHCSEKKKLFSSDKFGKEEQQGVATFPMPIC